MNDIGWTCNARRQTIRIMNTASFIQKFPRNSYFGNLVADWRI